MVRAMTPMIITIVTGTIMVEVIMTIMVMIVTIENDMYFFKTKN